MVNRHFHLVGAHYTQRQRLRVVFFAVVALLILGAVVAGGTGNGQLFEFFSVTTFVGLIMANLVIGRFGSRLLFVLSNWIPVLTSYAVLLERWLDSSAKGHSTGDQSDA